jgi:prepilin-type N-terminal cleavage/methylation domain-containing protein
MKRKGFTLVEVLIVIAIIALCAAIVLPLAIRSKTANNATLHTGDRVSIKSLHVKGVVDRTYGNRATIIVQGNDGYPVKLDQIDIRILVKE